MQTYTRSVRQRLSPAQYNIIIFLQKTSSQFKTATNMSFLYSSTARRERPATWDSMDLLMILAFAAHLRQPAAIHPRHNLIPSTCASIPSVTTSWFRCPPPLASREASYSSTPSASSPRPGAPPLPSPSAAPLDHCVWASLCRRWSSSRSSSGDQNNGAATQVLPMLGHVETRPRCTLAGGARARAVLLFFVMLLIMSQEEGAFVLLLFFISDL